MKVIVFLVLFTFWFGNANAESSTLRVSCVDQAIGAEVSINGKFKGECPIDIQVKGGKLHLKAVKTIADKAEVFEQDIKIGDGVTKRVDVTFKAEGTATMSSPTIQVNQNAVAQQRYEAEMVEYNNSIQSCLPKHAVELRKLEQALMDAYKVLWNECKVRRADHENDLCGPSSLDLTDSYELNYGQIHKTGEYKAYKSFDDNANSWCAKQFSKPQVSR